MISMYIGIDPSINSTGICIQTYSENKRLSIKFYIVHGGKLKKKELAAEQMFADMFEYVKYDKIDTKEYKGIDNCMFELAKTENLISIVASIDNIIKTEQRKLQISYPLEDIEKYITIEANSFNSRQHSVSLIELCGLNYLIRNLFFNKPLTTLIIGTPTELKKYATSKGNADKELVQLVFKTEYPELVESDIKTDDIADAFFMSNYSKKYAEEDTNDNFVKENELDSLVKEVFDKKKIAKKAAKEQAKQDKQTETCEKNKISTDLLNII